MLVRIPGYRPWFLAQPRPPSSLPSRFQGLPFQVRPSSFPEDLDKAAFPHPAEYVEENALRKACDVAGGVAGGVIIGADTVVVLDGSILEKPRDQADAESMLNRLSGRRHEVITGVCLLLKEEEEEQQHCREGEGSSEQNPRRKLFHVSTEVHFAPLSQELIKSYVDTQEPMDKAGGYGIQGIGGTLIEGIHGDYFNVVGLPLHAVCRELYQLLTSRGSS